MYLLVKEIRCAKTELVSERLEVDAEVQEQGVVVAGEVVVVNEVGDAKLIAQFQVELVVLSTAAQLEAHVVAVRAELVWIHTLTLVLVVGADSVGKVRTDEGQKGDVVGNLDAVLDQDGNLKVVVRDFHIAFLGTALGVVETRLEEYRRRLREVQADDAGEGHANLGTHGDVTAEGGTGTTKAHTVIQVFLAQVETATGELGESRYSH